MKLSSQFACVVALWASLAPLYAEGGSLHFQHLRVEDGLSQGTVTSIVQDRKGFVWIGTFDGLNRFDGLEFKIYRHDAANPQSLSSSWINCLFLDDEGTLWIGTTHGLNRFEPGTGTFVKYPRMVNDTLRSTDYFVDAIGESHRRGKREIWVGDPSLCVLDEPHAALIPAPITSAAPVGDSYVYSIEEDREGFLWVGDEGGFFRLDPITNKVDHTQNLSHGVNSIITPDGHGVSTFRIGAVTGLYSYNPTSGLLTSGARSLTACQLRDHAGRIWIGTDNGLGLDSGGESQSAMDLFRHDDASPYSLTNNSVRSLCEDSSGALWVGTYDGLDRLDQFVPGFTNYRHNPGDPNTLGNDFVLPILEDRAGDIWFGTFASGVSVLHRDEPDKLRFLQFQHDPRRNDGLCGNHIRTLLEDRAGTVWIGTDSGVSLFDPVRKTFRSELALHFWVNSLCEAPDGSIWLNGPNGEIIRAEKHQGSLRLKRFGLLGEKGPGKSIEAEALVADRSGTIWIATELGLVGLNPQTGEYVRYVHAANDSTTISDDKVWSIYEDTSQHTQLMWVGTSDGLNRFDVQTGTFRRYPGQEGFPNAFVYGILRDDLGRLWISTNHGLTRFDDRKPDGKKFKNYDVSDGVQGNEFNRHSFCRLRSGDILFGGTHGVTRFDPGQIRDNTYVPPVVLTSFTKLGKRMQFDRDIGDITSVTVQHDEDVFSFEFAALNYTNASRNRYEYMMEGFDKEWTYSGSRRYASYTHLDAGKYIFRVRGSNNDGVWNNQGTAIEMVILPPYWQTWWFRFAAVTILALGLVAGYRYRISKLRRSEMMQRQFTHQLLSSQEQERSRLAGELHDSLVQTLLIAKNRSLIGLKKSSDPDAVQRELNEISSAMSRSIDEVREIAHNLRPYQLDRLGLTKAIQSFVHDLAESSNIRFILEIDDVDSDFPGDQAILIYRVIQEATNNVVTHSRATAATVSVRKADHAVTLTIGDNGIGLSGNPPGETGFGLSGIAQRVRMLGGTLHLDSAPGKGTMLRVRVLLKGARQ